MPMCRVPTNPRAPQLRDPQGLKIFACQPSLQSLLSKLSAWIISIHSAYHFSAPRPSLSEIAMVHFLRNWGDLQLKQAACQICGSCHVCKDLRISGSLGPVLRWEAPMYKTSSCFESALLNPPSAHPLSIPVSRAPKNYQTRLAFHVYAPHGARILKEEVFKYNNRIGSYDGYPLALVYHIWGD